MVVVEDPVFVSASVALVALGNINVEYPLRTWYPVESFIPSL